MMYFILKNNPKISKIWFFVFLIGLGNQVLFADSLTLFTNHKVLLLDNQSFKEQSKSMFDCNIFVNEGQITFKPANNKSLGLTLGAEDIKKGIFLFKPQFGVILKTNDGQVFKLKFTTKSERSVFAQEVKEKLGKKIKQRKAINSFTKFVYTLFLPLYLGNLSL
jgi:hypothetical protein